MHEMSKPVTIIQMLIWSICSNKLANKHPEEWSVMSLTDDRHDITIPWLGAID